MPAIALASLGGLLALCQHHPNLRSDASGSFEHRGSTSAVALVRPDHASEVARDVADKPLPAHNQIPVETQTQTSASVVQRERSQLTEPSTTNSFPSITIRARASDSGEHVDAQSAPGRMKERSRSIELRADTNNCPGCSNSKSWGIDIPAHCRYVSHTLTLLNRVPQAPIEVSSDGSTSYQEEVEWDVHGKIEAVTLALTATDQRRAVPSSIAMRLTVVEVCPDSGD